MQDDIWVETDKLQSKKKQRAAVAACAGLLLCGGLLLFALTRLIPEPSSEEMPTELAILTIVESTYGEGGYSAFQAYDEQLQVQGADFEKMQTLLLDVIDGLELDAGFSKPLSHYKPKFLSKF